MDARRFDRLTRRFLASCDRRRVLGAVVFGVAGRAALVPGVDAALRACRNDNVPCTRGSQCCSGLCATDRTLPRRRRNRCYTCVPACDGKRCGDDGCGGTCGTCPPSLTCNDDGSCGDPCDEGTCDGGLQCLSADVCGIFPSQVGCVGGVCMENICADVPGSGEGILLNDGTTLPGVNAGTYNVLCETNADCAPVCGVVEGNRCVCGHTFCYDHKVVIHFSPICVANDPPAP